VIALDVLSVLLLLWVALELRSLNRKLFVIPEPEQAPEPRPDNRYRTLGD